MPCLVLIRHGDVFLNVGESQWNAENKFCGWVDVGLSEKGEKEAELAAKYLKDANLKFDVAYTSVLDRAIKTADIVLKNTGNEHLPRHSSWRLNERHYGALQGLNKAETATKYGDDQVKIWRRSYDVPPPAVDKASPHYPGNDPKYKDIPEKEIPVGESLKLTVERVKPYWLGEILPALNQSKNVLIIAHGNSLRAILKILEDVSEQDLLELNIPTAAPLYYKLDNGKVLEKKYLLPEEILQKKIQEVANQGKSKK